MAYNSFVAFLGCDILKPFLTLLTNSLSQLNPGKGSSERENASQIATPNDQTSLLLENSISIKDSKAIQRHGRSV